MLSKLDNTFFILFIFIFSPFSIIIADDSPKIMNASFKNCSPITELCGNGVDENCDGYDALCPLLDQDRDGYPPANDCDDTEHLIYPGIHVSCDKNCDDPWKVCKQNGSYSECSCNTLCEASGNGKCYYIDPLSGSDANPGTFTSRLKSLKPFGFYSESATKPSNRITLNAGDVVYLFSGTYKSSYHSIRKNSTVILRNLNGTKNNPITIKNYPGNIPVISPPKNSEGIYSLNNQHLVFQGLVIDGAYQAGLMIADSNDITLRNMIIRNTYGPSADNIAGLYVVLTNNLLVEHSIFHDNYDRVNSHSGGRKNENSRNIVLFRGGNARIHHSALYQTPEVTADKTGGCVVLKHSQSIPGTSLEIDHNTLQNCAFNAIGTGGFNGHFHHNLIVDSDIGLRVKDHGGHPNYANNLIEYNTFINTPALEYNPSEAASVGAPYKNLTFRNNIVSDNKSYSYLGVATFMIDPYGPNSVYNSMRNNNYFSSDNNCFYNSRGSALFSFFASNNTSERSLGNYFGLSGWKSFGYDKNSHEVNPEFTSVYSPKNDLCKNKGFLAY